MPIAKGKKAGSRPASRKVGKSAGNARASRPKTLSPGKKAAARKVAKKKTKPAAPAARSKKGKGKATQKTRPALKKAVSLVKKIAAKGKKAVKKAVKKAASKLNAIGAAESRTPARKGPAPKVSSPGAQKSPAGAQSKTALLSKATPAASASAAKPARPPAISRPPKAAKAPRGGRRPRPRITSDGGPVANWLTPENRPRPSSFIPAPPRAESPSLVAAPPASSDRLIHPDHLEAPAPGIRLYPVRIDIEQGGGRIFVVVNPEQINLRAGEGIEWDFRYLGGADAIVEEVVIEFPKAGAFSKTTFKSHKPGSARPHRQISGPATEDAAGKRVDYLIRCMNLFKREVTQGRATVIVSS